MARRTQYFREYARRRRQQFKKDMALLGTPVKPGRPRKPAPARLETKRSEDVARSASVIARCLGQDGVRHAAFREFRKKVSSLFTKGTRRTPPNDQEIRQALEACVAEGWVTLGPLSRRGWPKFIKFREWETPH